MFSPPGTPAQHFAQFGWVAGMAARIALPTATTVWTAPAGAKLTPRRRSR
jgi:YidC/Oxa1 family membrane protein insertase